MRNVANSCALSVAHYRCHSFVSERLELLDALQVLKELKLARREIRIRSLQRSPYSSLRLGFQGCLQRLPVRVECRGQASRLVGREGRAGGGGKSGQPIHSLSLRLTPLIFFQ